jgi:hypothetical protein
MLFVLLEKNIQEQKIIKTKKKQARKLKFKKKD